MAENYNSRWTGEQIDDAVALARQGSIITGAEATTLAAGSAATAAVEGNVLKIGVPKGAAGATGPQGPAGPEGPQGPAGPAGPAYTLTETDKNTIAAAVKDSLTTETWTFTLEDGSIVVKEIPVISSASKIIFTIESKTYYAEPGMLWSEWLNSEYNTGSYIASGNTITHPYRGGMLYLPASGTTNPIKVSATIIANAAYVLTQ